MTNWVDETEAYTLELRLSIEGAVYIPRMRKFRDSIHANKQPHTIFGFSVPEDLP
jgi:hypothetical protein